MNAISIKFLVLNITIPIICSGIIFSGLIFSIYIYYHWKNNLYLALALTCLASFIFVSSEGILTLLSYIINKAELGRQLHRIEQIGGAYFLFCIPFFLHFILDLNKKIKLLNKISIILGLLFAIFITLIAFIKSDLFVSVNEFASRSLGRGREGILYRIRDIFLGIMVIYSLILIFYDLIKNKRKFFFLIPFLTGILIAIYTALDDTLYIYYKIHIGLLPGSAYSRFTIGISIFTMFSIGMIFKNFIDQAKEVEKAYNKLNESEKKLEYIAYFDELTGLMNRKSFHEKFSDTINQAKRSKYDRLRALLLIDVDDMRAINDGMGHNFGDEVLKEVSKRIKKSMRGSDYLFRFGGDEFTILLTNMNNEIESAIVSQRIINTLLKSFTIKDYNFYLSINIGISLFPQDGDDPEILLKNADTALNDAKKEKNTYRYYTKNMELHILEKISLINNLRKAIEKEEFSLYYQPIINSEKRVIGAEALIRWFTPEGSIPPNKFIPIAEESMLIIPIGEWTIRKACIDFKSIHDSGLNDLKVSVNLSLRQFKQKEFINNFISIIKKTDFDPNYLSIEITESYFMHDIFEVIEKLKFLKNQGIIVSLDDFGTGYSSLNYLQQLPIDTIKIDRSFIHSVRTDKNTSSLVEAIVVLAKKLNLNIIFEGVETEKQVEYLKKLDPDMAIQGFYYSKPIPLDEFVDYVKKHNN